MFTIPVRCRECLQVVGAVPVMHGAMMQKHDRPDGTRCPTESLPFHHERVEAQAEREAEERARAEQPPPVRTMAVAPTPGWVRDERHEQYLEERYVEGIEGEDSGDYRARRRS